ncbi:MAG: class I SAM-dependent methyltransferase [Candidatus Kerfeldbacteria bacterium]|nr:class I SAM-dependent methyltransferase [Candidatus Kerfeldbacteria bacterium]
MQSYWNKQHEIYSKADWINQPSLFAEWCLQFFPPSGTLLDMGGGQGQDAKYFAEKGYQVTLIDSAETALIKAQERMLRTSNNIRIQHHDISKRLPYLENTFDVVYAHLSLHYFDTTTTYEIFNDIHRVLKTGGICAFLVNSQSDPEFRSGIPIEPGFLDVDTVQKRFFDITMAMQFTRQFQTIMVDARGETYKDRLTDNHNLIRYVGRK